MSRPYAEVIGDPIVHSKSPRIHNFWLDRLGLAGRYCATRVAASELGHFLADRRGDPDWRGCNVTIPHKIAAMAHLDAVEGAEIGAVNCIIPEGGRLRGLNTDVLGLAEALSGCAVGGPVVLVGAGGAARAALAWMRSTGVTDIRVVARESGKAERLLADFGAEGRIFGFDEAEVALTDAVGLLNGTPLGMNGFDPMPDSILTGLTRLERSSFVLDMVYAPVETGLLKAANQLGLRSIDGLLMLIGQAKAAFNLFYGRQPPADADVALRTILTS